MPSADLGILPRPQAPPRPRQRLWCALRAEIPVALAAVHHLRLRHSCAAAVASAASFCCVQGKFMALRAATLRRASWAASSCISQLFCHPRPPPASPDTPPGRIGQIGVGPVLRAAAAAGRRAVLELRLARRGPRGHPAHARCPCLIEEEHWAGGSTQRPEPLMTSCASWLRRRAAAPRSVALCRN